MPRDRRKGERLKKKKYSKAEILDYLGFETVPCPYCSGFLFNGYHRKGTQGEHSKCPYEAPAIKRKDV